MPKATYTKFPKLFGGDLFHLCEIVHTAVVFGSGNPMFSGESFLMEDCINVLWHALGNWEYENETEYDAAVRTLVSATLNEYLTNNEKLS